MQFDYNRLRDSRIVYGLLMLTVVLLVAVFAFPAVNGAQRWIKLKGFSIQPSELSKLSLVIFLAYYLEKQTGEEQSFWRTFVPCALVTGVLALLIVAEPDLGTAMMLAVVFAVLIYTAGARLFHLGLVALPAVIGVAGLLIFVPFRMRRMIMFLDPWADPQGSGFQVVQSLIAIGSGGPNGLGFAQGKQKMLFLPFAHSDFIFAVVGEELGLLGTLTVLLIFALFLWRGLRTSLLAPDRFGMLLSLGLVTGIVVQALFNISVVLSLVPTKGIPLPFISYGGSSLVPTLAAVGILLNISQHAAGSMNFGTLKSITARSQKPSRKLRPEPARRMASSRFG
ncbi:MAG: putative lipid II flippase FtsW, partial [Acidobacteriota bacterium]|nr:putative lipid II flippase FtsW [Acidobacteriota bacterium]